MRYFTRQWYDRLQEHYFADAPMTEEEGDGPSTAYGAHLARIGPRLPPDLLFVATHLSLHDGLFKGVSRHPPARQMAIRLRCGDHPSGYFDLTLIYQGVALITEPGIGLDALVDNSAYEVLHDEVDIGEHGLYEHRLLLWPEGEVILRFSGFTYTRLAILDRYAP